MSWYSLVKKSAFFYDQTFSDGDGTWKVPDIEEYARTNGKRIKVPVRSLLNNLEPSPRESGDELPGHPEFIDRANEADLSYPIIVVKYPDGLWIADGVHRLWKARDEGLEEIAAYVINHSELSNIEQANELV
jgi:hypothetical protein